MSAWRRDALRAFPEWRRRVEAAVSPEALWQDIYRSAIEACARDPVDADLLGRIFRHARDSRGPDQRLRSAVEAELYEKLFDEEAVRPHFQRLLLETEFLRLEARLARRFSPADFARLRAQFYEVRDSADAGTTLGIVRKLKDRLLRSASIEVAELISRTWARTVDLFEVHEDVVGLEIFLDNLGETMTPIRRDIEQELREILERLTTAARGARRCERSAIAGEDERSPRSGQEPETGETVSSASAVTTARTSGARQPG